MKYKIEMDESDENFDRDDINIITNRHKVKRAFYELQDLIHVICNRKFYDDTDYKYDKDTDTLFVDIDWIEDKVRKIYDNFKFLNEYE